tara:strand:+ start:395 stop:1339 length:945 start_codon:yes stop_codon:yes gene_type:complete
MNEEMMTAGTGGFSGSAAATGPNAGYDPVMKFRSKVKSKKDKKLVMPGNELKAEDTRSYQEKLNDVVLEKKLERINKLREQGYDLSEEQINEFLGGVLKGVGNAVKGVMGSKPKPDSGAAASATSSVAGGKIPPSIKFGASSMPKPGVNLAQKFDASGKSRFQRGIGEFAPKKVPAANTANPSPSQAKPNPMQANRPGFDGKGISNSGGSGMAGAAVAALKKAASKKKGLSAMKEAASAPQDQPVGLYQYKVTVPEMGTTIIYASSPAELMIKFRMLFNPRFIKQIKIERISPHKAGELFYVKRLKHLRNIKSD